MVRLNTKIKLAACSVCLLVFLNVVAEIRKSTLERSIRLENLLRTSRKSILSTTTRKSISDYLKKSFFLTKNSSTSITHDENNASFLPLATMETNEIASVSRSTIIDGSTERRYSTEKQETTADLNNLLNVTEEELVQHVRLRPKSKFLKPITLTNAACEVDQCISKKKVKWKMVIFVKSACSNSFKREMIRRTWGSVQYVDGGQLSTVFILGRVDKQNENLVNEEYERFGDMLFIDESDDYLNVSFKTLAGMQWATERLQDDMYYSSSDDDMMVNVAQLQEYVDRYIKEKSTNGWPEFPIICSYEYWEKSSNPVRDKKNKNFVSNEKYRWTLWPKFCLGGMYTTSVSVIKQLYHLSRTKQLLNTDDVWITGVLRNILGMPEAMLIKPKPAIAKHIEFSKKFDNERRVKRLMGEWNTINEKLKSKTTCRC